MNLSKKVAKEIENNFNGFQDQFREVVEQLQHECNDQDELIRTLESRVVNLEDIMQGQDEKLAEFDRTLRSLCDQHI